MSKNNNEKFTSDNYLYSDIFNFILPDLMTSYYINKIKKNDFYLSKNELGYVNESGIRYIYLKHNIITSGIFVVSLYNNYTKIKVWINHLYIGYYDELTRRVVVQMEEGENEIIIEAYSPNVLDVKILITEYKKNLYDDFNDIRKINTFFEIKDNTLYFFTQQDFFGQENPKVELLIPKIDFIKRKIKFKKIKYPDTHLYSKEKIDLTDYIYKCNLGWLFIKVNTQYKRIFLKDIYDSFVKLENMIEYNKNYFTKWEYDKIREISIKSKEIDLSLYDKYYLLYGQIVRFFGKYTYESQNDYYILPGYKEIEYTSNLDEKKSIYGLYVPENISNIRELELILILSSHSYNTYIDTYSRYFKNNYLIAEINLKGNNYGNYIGEYLVFEVINNIKMLFPNHIITKKILFGYSSSASAVTTLCGKYPYEFNCCLAVAGKSNEYLLKNINETVPTIAICGNYDSDVNDVYYRNNKILSKKLFVQNILLNGYDHTSIQCLMRSKKLINRVLKFKKQFINHGYFGISEDYFPMSNIKIIDRIDKNKPYYVYLNHEKKNYFFKMLKKYFF